MFMCVFRSIGKFSFFLCYTLEHTNMYTDMCTETPTQSSVNVPAVIVGVVNGSLILMILAFVTGFGLGICVHFRKKSKQTTGTSIISLYVIALNNYNINNY